MDSIILEFQAYFLELSISFLFPVSHSCEQGGLDSVSPMAPCGKAEEEALYQVFYIYYLIYFFTTIQWHKYNYHSHFPDEDTETQRL